MVKLKPWYQVVIPREDLRGNRPMEASLLQPHGFRSAFRQEFRSPKPSVLERLGTEPTLWSAMVWDFGRAFKNAAGTEKSVSEARSRKTHRKFYRAQV